MSGAGTCEEVLLQTGGRVDHLPVFADVSVQPLQGKKNVQRKKCICDVRMARFDNDAIQRFEAAMALAPAMPLTLDVDQHAGLLARFVRQTAAQGFPKETARRKKDWISDDTWKLILAKKTILMEQRKARAWAGSMLSLEGMGRLDRSKCCPVSSDKSVVFYCGQLRLVAVQRHKLAELTDQVRKAMRVDWCAHVDEQALEAQNAAMSHNSEQLYQVVKNLACKQSKGFKCTRIRLEDGTLASHYGDAQARWLRFHAGEFRCQDSVRTRIQCCIVATSVDKAPL